jgi:hypothetical protein
MRAAFVGLLLKAAFGLSYGNPGFHKIMHSAQKNILDLPCQYEDGRYIPRDIILVSVDRYEIIETYPDDKYLSSCLVYACHEDIILHILFALDRETDSVRIITAYKPSPDKWGDDGKTRRTP